jgi:hypothetical protein
MAGYLQLDREILNSTVWVGTDTETKVLWIFLLLVADRNGIIHHTLPAIARDTGLERGTVERSLRSLRSPDSDSRSPEYEGRRIEYIDPDNPNGGIKILNYMKYKKKSDDYSTIRRQRYDANHPETTHKGNDKGNGGTAGERGNGEGNELKEKEKEKEYGYQTRARELINTNPEISNTNLGTSEGTEPTAGGYALNTTPPVCAIESAIQPSGNGSVPSVVLGMGSVDSPMSVSSVVEPIARLSESTDPIPDRFLEAQRRIENERNRRGIDKKQKRHSEPPGGLGTPVPATPIASIPEKGNADIATELETAYMHISPSGKTEAKRIQAEVEHRKKDECNMISHSEEYGMRDTACKIISKVSKEKTGISVALNLTDYRVDQQVAHLVAWARAQNLNNWEPIIAKAYGAYLATNGNEKEKGHPWAWFVREPDRYLRAEPKKTAEDEARERLEAAKKAKGIV